MPGKLAVAFAAGLASVVTPCVLPLIPGYLSSVSGFVFGATDSRAPSRRVILATVPFILGFTAVFVALGVGAAAIGGVVDKALQLRIAGFLLIVVGLTFVGLLPWPQRTFVPAWASRAKERGSRALLGAAFAVCAAPCIGPVLASILVLASGSGGVEKASVLLAAYSLGLGAAFLAAGLAFSRTMSAFRFVRDRFRLIESASGAILVGLGLLLFFDRSWWLQLAVDQALIRLGLESG